MVQGVSGAAEISCISRSSCSEPPDGFDGLFCSLDAEEGAVQALRALVRRSEALERMHAADRQPEAFSSPGNPRPTPRWCESKRDRRAFFPAATRRPAHRLLPAPDPER